MKINKVIFAVDDNPLQISRTYIQNTMKKIALISTYCDTEEKLQILEQNILVYLKFYQNYS